MCVCVRHDVELVVEGATGGKWRFPLRFTSTEAEPDDVIRIHAVALNKDATVGIHLTSQSE